MLELVDQLSRTPSNSNAKNRGSKSIKYPMHTERDCERVPATFIEKSCSFKSELVKSIL